MEVNPFQNTVIADWAFLDSSPRSQCLKCKKSRKYYCYTCCAPLPHLISSLPKVKLPVKVDIIKHQCETDGKSTAPHAVILAPDDVTIHTYPCIPDYDIEKVVLVFPGQHSLTLDELAAKCLEQSADTSLLEENERHKPISAEICGSMCTDTHSQSSTGNKHSDLHPDKQLLSQTDDIISHKLECPENNKTLAGTKTSQNGQFCESQPLKRSLSEITSDNGEEQKDEFPSKKIKTEQCLPFEKVVFIDATWNQTHNMISDERLKNLKRVEIRTRNSNFWRCQEGVPKTYLSTIEAIYYFFKDFHTLFLESEYRNQYDNLLFFFCHIYNRIQKSSKGGKHIK